MPTTTPPDFLARALPGKSFRPNGNALVVAVSAEDLADSVRTLMRASLPLHGIFATDEREENGAFHIHYVFGIVRASGAGGGERFIVLNLTAGQDGSFPSLAREFAGCAFYEREILTFFGLTPVGHPDPRSLILHEENWPRDMYPLRKDFAWDTRVPETHAGDYEFKRIGGEGIYEIPVGPVHAGIIEPGHFRFSVLGEEILALEPRLGWVHKGIEKLFEGASLERAVELAEHVSGDSAFSHSLALTEALESLARVEVSARAKHLRVFFAELERLTMHIFDIGNIAGNGTGFSFMAAQGFRLVEMLRRVSEEVGGHRYLRGVNVFGGVSYDLTDESVERMQQFFTDLSQDFAEIIAVGDTSASLANRLNGTGTLPQKVALDYGASGVPARACGIERDARLDYPYAAYSELVPVLITTSGGDVNARFQARIKEVYESLRLIDEALRTLPPGPIRVNTPTLPAEGFGVGIVEGWRGEIVYAVQVNNGVISRVKVRDPSFIHWQIVSHLSSKDMVPDFPLINKSFNLSYTGNDL